MLAELVYYSGKREGHIVILTFEGTNKEACYLQVIQNSPPEFAEAAMEIHGLDENAVQPPLPELVYSSNE